MVQLQDISLRRGPNLLLEAASCTLYPGQKTGLVGANGCGKSSLFALLSGQVQADTGTVSIPAGWQLAQVAQHTPDSDREAIEFVLDGDGELRDIQARLAAAEQANDGLRHGELLGRFETVGGYSAPSRAARLLHGLGFAPGEERRRVNEYSGGWRMRLALARTLMSRSDLLLLDEPTNHLDLDAVIWLESWLRAYPGTLLLISHDRDFLDAIVEQILHIQQQQLTLYSGNYSAFERQRAERLAQQQAAHVRQQREIAHMRGFVERFRAKATKARQAQSRLKALERMELIAPAHVDSAFHFEFRAPEKLPRPLLRLDGVSAGYGDQTILAGVDLTLAPGERIGLLGRNGAGKSTLMRILAGILSPRGGRCQRAQDLRLGYFAQHQVEQLDCEATPLLHLQRLDAAANEQTLRDFLAGFGFAGERALTAVAPFSGGEKARLVLALIVYQRPNLLLLDEPTNHLDLDMRHALASALQGYEGALVVVSHDRHLLRVSADTLLLVDAGQVTPFAGDLDEYPAWLAGRTDVEAASGAAAATDASGNQRVRRRRDSAERRKALQPLRTRVRELERRIAELDTRRSEMERELTDPDLYRPSEKSRLLALTARQRSLIETLETTEAEWLAESEALEAAEAQPDGSVEMR